MSPAFARGVQGRAVSRGRSYPLGAVITGSGVNFSVFSQNAAAVELLLFDSETASAPVGTVALFHSHPFWHAHIDGLGTGTYYAFRADGSTDLTQGHRFNRNKVLLDPYARATSDLLWDRAAACTAEDNVASALRAVVVDESEYDWEGDQPLRTPMEDTIIYEVHVGGWSRSPSSGSAFPGTFHGITEKIPYLKSLGITAVELLPVFSFDAGAVLRTVDDGTQLRNYWGYSTVSYFAPEETYCREPHRGSHVREFRDMVKALHKAGIEVILDVVFNHTDEGNENGPCFSFRGLDNSVYYYLWPGDKQYYWDFSGCGNSLQACHPIVQKFVLECLEYWVREMHVDGFRFDEAAVLSRGPDGTPLQYPALPWNLEMSEELAGAKLIAEAWDAAGLYEVGGFSGYRWAEWNGRYRDTIRRFVRGDRGIVGEVATRIAGSADLYQHTGRLPTNSVNFITCHDGFTLNDLVSYNSKRNDANGESNRDGVDDNLSWNCGAEGQTSDPAIEALRERQAKNFFSILLLSAGVPLFVAGDEFRRTQRGNNNAYCQDNEISWIDWENAEMHADLLRFVRTLVHWRRQLPSLRRAEFFDGRMNDRGLPDIAWHGCALNAPGWNDPNCGVLAFTIGADGSGADLHVMLNMEPGDLQFEVPAVTGRQWLRLVDTALPSPMDITAQEEDAKPVALSYRVTGRSVVVLMSAPMSPADAKELS
jgi:isoamylase